MRSDASAVGLPPCRPEPQPPIEADLTANATAMHHARGRVRGKNGVCDMLPDIGRSPSGRVMQFPLPPASERHDTHQDWL